MFNKALRLNGCSLMCYVFGLKHDAPTRNVGEIRLEEDGEGTKIEEIFFKKTYIFGNFPDFFKNLILKIKSAKKILRSTQGIRKTFKLIRCHFF